MARLTAKQIADKQIRKSQQATEDYLQGIDSVQEAPTQRAKRKKDKMKANFLKAMEEGKWEDGLDAWTNEDWKEVTKKKGGARYSDGVTEARPQIEAFHEDFQAFIDRVKVVIDKMPDVTPEQRIAKMVANAKAIATYKRGKRRR